MKNINDVREGFGVLESSETLQTAVMRLEHGEESGPYGNEHPDSVQMLLVVSGELSATVGGVDFSMKPGDSVMIARSVPHRFVGASERAVVTFNVYSPPAY